MVTDFTSNLQRTSRTRGLPPPPATSTPARVYVARVCMALHPFGAEHATATPLFAGIKSLGMRPRGVPSAELKQTRDGMLNTC